MEIKVITENKQDFISLLLLADAPKYISHYLERGTLFVNHDEDCAAVVTDEKNNCVEIQNFAVAEHQQGMGIGKNFLFEICQSYPDKVLIVRTDEYTAEFYEKCGFTVYKRVKNYFPEKYGKRVFDKGRELIDNIYLKKNNEFKKAELK
jgi:ribosomal protein S18 acetylase RimI-like enzyme